MSQCESPSSFGKLNARQQAVVRRFVSGRVVLDLGAGSFELSRCLVDLGASRVFAVERTAPYGGVLEVGTPYQAVTVVAAGLRGLGQAARHHRRAGTAPPVSHRPADVVFVSWPSPQNRLMSARLDYSILEPIRKARVVVYLGNNMDGTICGFPELYRHLGRREVLAHEPAKRNTLIVYGRLLRGQERELLPEEQAGIDHTKIYYYREVYRRVSDEELM